jgi:ribonuclease HI
VAPAGAEDARTRVVIYCDGACSPNPGVGGWGAILLLPGREDARREISGAEKHSTNNRMELTAALMALRALNRPCDVDVYTDSRYLRDAFEAGWLARWQRNGWRTSSKQAVANEDLWRELLALTDTHEVRWHWVAAHADNALNNRADALAVAAREALAARR